MRPVKASKSVEKKTTREIFHQNIGRTAPPTMSQLIIWLHNVRSMHNVGAAFRSADVFGTGMVLLSGYTPFPPRAEITKTALGADQNVPWKYEKNPDLLLQWCRNRSFHLIGLEQTRQSGLLTDFLPETGIRYCLLFGNEVTGLDLSLLSKCDRLLEIPQYGKKHSLNISVSIGVTLYHMLLGSINIDPANAIG